MRLVAIAYFAAILLVVALADFGGLLGTLTYIHSIPWGDKVVHLILATGLGFFANVLLREPVMDVGGMRIQRANLMLFPAVFLEELSQKWIPGRTFDLRDLAANALGLVLGSALALSYSRRRTLATA